MVKPVGLVRHDLSIDQGFPRVIFQIKNEVKKFEST
jgi:hypothetical protein